MDLREEADRSCWNDPNLDEDEADILKAAACLLAAASVKRGQGQQAPTIAPLFLPLGGMVKLSVAVVLA